MRLTFLNLPRVRAVARAARSCSRTAAKHMSKFGRCGTKFQPKSLKRHANTGVSGDRTKYVPLKRGFAEKEFQSTVTSSSDERPIARTV